MLLDENDRAISPPRPGAPNPDDLTDSVSPGIIDYLENQDGSQEPGFGVDASQPQQESAPEGRVMEQILNSQKGKSSYVDRWEQSLRKRKQAVIQKRAQAKAGKAVATQAGKAAAKFGLRTLGATLSAGTSLLAEAAIDVALWFITNRKVVLATLLIALAIHGFNFLIVGASTAYISGINTDGANHNGGTLLRQQTDSYNPDVATQDSGLVIGTSVESINVTVDTLSKLLEKQPPAGANTGEADRIIEDIESVRTDLQSHVYSRDHQKELVEKYRQLVTQLVGAIFPGRKAAGQEVVNRIGNSITVERGGACNPEGDIKRLALTENSYRVIIAASDQAPVTVKCLVSGHRKYVGKPPSQGNPRCGELKTIEQDKVSQSLHCLGRAVDFAPNTTVLSYLNAHKSDLKIEDVVLEKTPPHIHVEVLP